MRIERYLPNLDIKEIPASVFFFLVHCSNCMGTLYINELDEVRELLVWFYELLFWLLMSGSSPFSPT